MQRVYINFNWLAKKYGGLYIGLRANFPTYILYSNQRIYKTRIISIGLLFFQISVRIRGKRGRTITQNIPCWKNES
jgi:hypothetical protein